jgi:hypothetical protein
LLPPLFFIGRIFFMQSFDLCVAWNWVGDSDFIMLLDEACRTKNVSLLLVSPVNLGSVMQSLVNNQLTFRSFFDRASDSDPGFNPIMQWAKNHGVYYLNPRELEVRVQDKGFMHGELISAGIYTPYTIVLPSYEEQPNPSPVDLSPLGACFAIKPAHGGGGEGVVLEATSWKQVLATRQQYPKDKYLLQAQIFPVRIGARPAWFRVICCCGEIHPSWWDPRTRIYTPVSAAEENLFRLTPLRSIVTSLAMICSGLELFSTEIALTSENRFVVIDYVNDQIDLRVQSKAVDGVPDTIVRDIVARLISLVSARCPPLAP